MGDIAQPFYDDGNEPDLVGGCSNELPPISARCQSLVQIENTADGWCLARAILVGLAWKKFCHRNNPTGRLQIPIEFRRFTSENQQLKIGAEELMKRAAVSTSKLVYGIPDVQRFQKYFDQTLGHGEIRLVVFSHARQNNIVYKGASPAAKFDLCLYLESNHFNFIGKPSQLFRVIFYIFA